MKLISLLFFVLASMPVFADEVHFNIGTRYEIGEGNERNEFRLPLEVEYLFGSSNQFGALAGTLATQQEPYTAITLGRNEGALRSYVGLGYAVVYTNAGFQTFAQRAISPTETVTVATQVPNAKKDGGLIALVGTEIAMTDMVGIGGRFTYGKTNKYELDRSTVALYLSLRFR